MNLLNISGSPHVHSDESTKKIMWRVNLALVPMLLCGIVYFGLNALLISLVSVACCCLFQWLIEKFILKVHTTVCDGSAVVTGLLLAFNVPATADLMTFGGLGKNPFNPALVGRVFMLISFPVQMTTWPTVGKWFPMTLDTTTGATPLGLLASGKPLPSNLDMFLGTINGSMGEISAIALLIGGCYLLWRKVITWEIPVAFLGSMVVMAVLMHQDPIFHIFAGGAMLGSIFMATDYVTSPITSKGKIIFGIGCGILTMLIRIYGSYPEGVSFAILLMNILTPHIDRWTRTYINGVDRKAVKK